MYRIISLFLFLIFLCLLFSFSSLFVVILWLGKFFGFVIEGLSKVFLWGPDQNCFFDLGCLCWLGFLLSRLIFSCNSYMGYLFYSVVISTSVQLISCLGFGLRNFWILILIWRTYLSFIILRIDNNLGHLFNLIFVKVRLSWRRTNLQLSALLSRRILWFNPTTIFNTASASIFKGKL